MTPSVASNELTVEVDGRPHLAGVRCVVCGTHAFPAQLACSRCGGETEPVALPDRGTLWSWTVQRLAPKAPFVAAGEFEPFAVGYVDLGVVRVESRLAGRPPDSWQIGADLQLAVPGADGAPGVYFWFEGGAS